MTRRSGARVLVVGGTGMLGHKVWQVFRERFETWVTVRSAEGLECTGLFSGDRVIPDVQVERFDTVVRACATANPSVIVNCAGIVKQRKAAADTLSSIAVNALFPHQAAAQARAAGARFIHISTDCVFAGTRGSYSERDTPDATDVYGRTKLLGEVAGPGSLTLRTSIIGRELAGATGLTEWFLAQRGGRVKGFTRAWFSGVTTLALANTLAEVIDHHSSLEGIYHVASAPISKYDLLRKLNEVYAAGIDIEPADDLQIDRTLDGSAFADATGLRAAGWDQMLADMTSDPTPYDQWRRQRV